jgi:hypothetical protein
VQHDLDVWEERGYRLAAIMLQAWHRRLSSLARIPHKTVFVLRYVAHRPSLCYPASAPVFEQRSGHFIRSVEG